MEPEKRLKGIISTGEVTPEQWKRILLAIGSVVSINSLKTTAVIVPPRVVKPPKERPSCPEIPQDLIGRLGSMEATEFFKLLEGNGQDKGFVTRLWNSLGRKGLLTRPEEPVRPPVRFTVISSENGRKGTVYRRGLTPVLAENSDLILNLDALAGELNSGEINNAADIGEKSEAAYHTLVQGRAAFLESEQQINGRPAEPIAQEQA